RRYAYEADGGYAQRREVARKHRAIGTRRVVGRRPRHGPDGRIREGLRIEPGGLLGVAVVPETDRVLRRLGHGWLLASRVGAGYGRIGAGHKYRGVGGHWGQSGGLELRRDRRREQSLRNPADKHREAQRNQ